MNKSANNFEGYNQFIKRLCFAGNYDSIEFISQRFLETDLKVVCDF